MIIRSCLSNLYNYNIRLWFVDSFRMLACRPSCTSTIINHTILLNQVFNHAFRIRQSLIWRGWMLLLLHCHQTRNLHKRIQGSGLISVHRYMHHDDNAPCPTQSLQHLRQQWCTQTPSFQLWLRFLLFWSNSIWASNIFHSRHHTDWEPITSCGLLYHANSHLSSRQSLSGSCKYSARTLAQKASNVPSDVF